MRPALLMFLAACAYEGPDVLAVAPAPPAWVERAGGLYRFGTEPVLLGVGSASGFKNPALRQVTADNRARSDLARRFKELVVETRRFQLGGDGCPLAPADPGAPNRWQLPPAVPGVRIIDRWIAPDNTAFTLVALDVEGLQADADLWRLLGSRLDDVILRRAQPW